MSLAEIGDEIGDELNLDAGLWPTTMHRWETGQRLPRGEEAIAYLRILRRLEKILAGQ